jgi:Putative restriction endonuclease
LTDVAKVSRGNPCLITDQGGTVERSGVKEYIVWRVLDRQIDWFSLRDGQYERMSVDDAGLYKSEVFPGLWLDAAALVRGDIKTVVAALERGLASAEHAGFVARLQSPSLE